MDVIVSAQYVDLVYDVYDGTDEDMMVPSLSPVVIFHGLLDNKENWIDIARSIADKSVRKVYVLDMRNHGESPKTVNMTHEANVNDLEMFLKKIIKEPAILVGHSLGGTAAMDIAFKKPHLVKGLVLIDVSPLRYPENEESRIHYIINEIKILINHINSMDGLKILKDDIDYNLHKCIKNDSLRKIILSNLVKNCQGYTLKVNLDSIEVDLCQKKKMKEVYPLRGCYRGQTLLVHGNSSDYILPSDYEKLKISFPNSSVSCINNCGHWIHIEKPDDLTEDILHFMSKCALL